MSVIKAGTFNTQDDNQAKRAKAEAKSKKRSKPKNTKGLNKD